MSKKDVNGATPSAPTTETQGEAVDLFDKVVESKEVLATEVIEPVTEPAKSGDVVVIHPFVCKYNEDIRYEIGDVLVDFDDERIEDVIQKGLAKIK